MQLFEYMFHSATLYGMMLYGGVKAFVHLMEGRACIPVGHEA